MKKTNINKLRDFKVGDFLRFDREVFLVVSYNTDGNVRFYSLNTEDIFSYTRRNIRNDYIILNDQTND